MSLRRIGSFSSPLLFLLAAACGDGEPAGPAMQGAQIEVADEKQDESKDDEKVAEEPDALGLPCNVKEFLAMNCQRCHGAEAKNGTPLLSRDNLLAVAKKDPNATVVQRALLRMVETEKPMPPAGKGDRVSEANLEMFTAWVDEGMPAGHCDQEFTPPAPPAPATPATPAVATPATPASP